MMLRRSVLVLLLKETRCSMTDFCKVMLIYTHRTSVSGCSTRTVVALYSQGTELRLLLTHLDNSSVHQCTSLMVLFMWNSNCHFKRL